MKWQKALSLVLFFLAFLTIFSLIRRPLEKGNETINDEKRTRLEGVRTDVMSFINSRNLVDTGVRGAAIQFARAYQQVLDESSVFNTSGKAASREGALRLQKQMARALGCLIAQFGIEKADSLTDEIEKRTFNTAERARIYLKFNGALSGSVLQSPVADKSLCD